MSNALRARKVGGIIAETFRVYKRSFLTLVFIVASAELIPCILTLLGVYLPALPWVPVAASTMVFLYSIIVLPLVPVALIYAVSKQYLGETIVDIPEAYSFAWGTQGLLILVGLLAGFLYFIIAIPIITAFTFIAIAGPLFPAFILPPVLIYFMVRWSLVLQIVSLERPGSARATLRRSSALVKGNWWRVLGTVIVLYIITIAFMLPFLLPLFSRISGGVRGTGEILSAISDTFSAYQAIWTIIGSILLTPIFVIGTTLLYYDLRVRKEGYDLKTLSKELGI